MKQTNIKAYEIIKQFLSYAQTDLVKKKTKIVQFK